MDKYQLAQIRALPLETVLTRFGAQRDPKDPRRNWRFGASRITVTGEKFHGHTRAQGGGGAIDLALHLLGYGLPQPPPSAFREAATWLGASPVDMPTGEHPTPLSAPVPRPSASPEPYPAALPRVRWYLTQVRALPPALVDQVIAKHLVFADRHYNVVFRLRDETLQEVGYALRGTRDERYPYHRTAGHRGLFIVGSGADKVAAFVESAIDALSYKTLRPQTLVLSTTGEPGELVRAMAQRLRQQGFAVIAAFDADRAGDRFAAKLVKDLDGAVTRHRPDERLGKDWNTALRSQRDIARAPAPPAETLTR